MAGSTGTYVKADVVVEEASASVDHLDVVELVFAHRLKHRNLHCNAPEIELSSFIWIHAVELCCRLAPPCSLYDVDDDTHIWGGDLDIPGILRKNLLVVNIRFQK